MDKESVKETLRSLKDDDKARSNTARLRAVFDEVEEALAAGVKRKAILEALRGHGFTLSAKTFYGAIHKIRRERRQAGIRPQEKQPAAHPAATTAKPLKQPLELGKWL